MNTLPRRFEMQQEMENERRNSATGANRSFRSGFEADYCWSNNNDRDDGCACVRSGVYMHDTRVCAETMTACDDF